MADVLGRDGKRRSWEVSDCPPIASNYVLQILHTSFPSMGVPEPAGAAHALAEVLDRLSAGERERAAELLAQRFKAVELSLHDGDRSRATHLELLPPSGRHLTSREEETLVPKELRDEMRVKRCLQEGGTSSQGPGTGRGRGSGAPRPEARNGSVQRERGAVRERSRDGKRDKEKDQKKGNRKRRGRK